jgi:hypothetical protein
MQDVTLAEIHLTDEQRFLAEPAEIERYRAFHADRGVLPPVRLTRENGRFRVLDRVECLLAAETLSLAQVTAIIEPRTVERKRKDILAMLGDPKWSLESSKALSRYTYTRREDVVNLRASHGDPTAERRVQRGGQTYTITPGSPRSNVPICFYDRAFTSSNVTPEGVDVILTVPPCDVPIVGTCARLLSALKADGTLYMLFLADQLREMTAWQSELENRGLPFAGLLCWKVKDCSAGLPGFELILAMGQTPPGLDTNQVIVGPRSADAQDVATLYRKPTWLAARLLKAHQGQSMLDPFVRTRFALSGAQQAGVSSASGYLLSSEYREEVGLAGMLL